MKKVLAILTCLSMVSCTTNTKFGPCIGAFDKQNPNLEYKMSAWNISLAIFFISCIFPTVHVIVNETFCPVGVVK
jgi:hypothetical protein